MGESTAIQRSLPRPLGNNMASVLPPLVRTTSDRTTGAPGLARVTKTQLGALDRFDPSVASGPRRPIIIYVGAGDTSGSQLASFLRARGQHVWVRDTSRDPRAERALRSLLLERGEEPNLPLPIVDFHINDMRPISWNADVNRFDSSMWSWLSGRLADAWGETPVRTALPLAAAAREHAMQGLRRRAQVLPAAQSPFFAGHGERPLGSALDVVTTSFASMAEGVMRIPGVGLAGVRQALSGLVTAPLAIATLPLLALETASMLPLDAFVRLYSHASGAAAVLLAIVLAILTVLLLPVNICLFVTRMVVLRPILLAAQWLAEQIAGEDRTRISAAAFPTELASEGTPIGAIERSNMTQPELADPETWVRHYQQASLGTVTLTPLLIRQLTTLRSTDPASYDRLRSDLADAGIQCFYRFPSLEMLQRTLADRSVRDERPVALVIASPSDHNGSFMTLATTVSQLAQGHRVLYVEAIDDVEVAATIARVGSQQQITTLVLAGHGVAESARMSADDDVMNGRNTVDIFDDDRLAPLRACFARGASIILEACSTGATRPHGESLAEMLHRIWPETTVYAPTSPDRNAGLRLDSRGRVIGSASVYASERSFS